VKSYLEGEETMLKRALLVLTAVALGVALFLGEALAYTVIVNQTAGGPTLTADEVSRAFLRKLEQWPNGTKVEPIDLVADSPVREAFTKEIHGRPVAAVQKYWQTQVFAGRGVPPKEAPEEDVVKFVASTPGAIGYVSDEAKVAGVAGIVVVQVK
jgi:ABC-type phosphate transport system substrate-binding protein